MAHPRRLSPIELRLGLNVEHIRVPHGIEKASVVLYWERYGVCRCVCIGEIHTCGTSGHTVSSELCSRKRRVCEMWQRVQSFFASTCLLVAALPALPTADSVFLHRSPLQTSTLVLLFLCDPSCCRQASSEASSGRGTLRATTAMSARPLSRHASHVTCSSLQADGGSCKSAGAPFV